jgi:polar amino acid transport system substrate-binding protein
MIRFADGSTGTIFYSSLGEPSAPKEYIEVLADNRVIRLDDFRRLTVTAHGKTSTSKAAHDKGQSALVAAFLAATRRATPAPIPLGDLVAVTKTTFAIEEALRIGQPIELA